LENGVQKFFRQKLEKNVAESSFGKGWKQGDQTSLSNIRPKMWPDPF
jgi:hypothetical protein